MTAHPLVERLHARTLRVGGLEAGDGYDVPDSLCREAADLIERLQTVTDAVTYAMREGCLFDVPEPKPGATTQELIQWGAMRGIHSAVAALSRGDSRG